MSNLMSNEMSGKRLVEIDDAEIVAIEAVLQDEFSFEQTRIVSAFLARAKAGDA